MFSLCIIYIVSIAATFYRQARLLFFMTAVFKMGMIAAVELG